MNENLRPLSPFQEFCVKFLGYVPSSYDDCLTYLECLLYTYNYLKNEIVPTVNQQNVVVQELKDFVEHYFDNLDVQEEINNKLDVMASDGTLEEMITEYIQLKGLLMFDTVSDMKTSDNLIVGSFAKTLGFYNKTDNGGGLYKIRELEYNEQYNDMNIIQLDSGLVADLIIPLQLNIKSIGASTDNDDNVEYIEQALNLSNTILIENGTYKTSYINITSDCNIIGNNATLEHVSNSDANNNCVIKSVSQDIKIELNKLIIDCKNHLVNGVTLSNVTSLIANECTIKNVGNVGYSSGNNHSRDGMFLNVVTNATINNCIFKDIERDGVLGYPVLYLNLHDCNFDNCGRFPSANTQNDGQTGGDYVNPVDTMYLNNYVTNCGGGGFDVEGRLSLAKTHFTISNNSIINCGDDDWGYSWGIVAGNNSYGTISNNNIQNMGVNSTHNDRGSAIVIGSTGDDVEIIGNNIYNSHFRGIHVENTGHDVTISNNSIDTTGHNGIFISSNPHTNISGNIVKNCNRHGIALSLSSSSHITNNTIKNCSLETDNTYDGINSSLCFLLNIVGNNVSGTKMRYGFYLDNASYKTQTNLVANKFYGALSGWFNFAPSNCPDGNIENGTCIFTSTSNALPSSGQWYVGDKIYFYDYAVNTYVGAVCTVSGTPGTWKRFGQIES